MVVLEDNFAEILSELDTRLFTVYNVKIPQFIKEELFGVIKDLNFRLVKAQDTISSTDIATFERVLQQWSLNDTTFQTSQILHTLATEGWIIISPNS